jgi:hypothetical protein
MLKTSRITVGCLTDVSEAELARVPITCVDGCHDRQKAPEFCAHL